MARIEAAPEVLGDFDRFFDHLAEFAVPDAPARIEEILQAVDVLATSPLIGRPVEAGKRELVIGRGSHGYVALYRYVPEVDTVFLLAVRHQREAGYGRDV
jgi:plasmid stabilization system protein ParE